MKRLWWVLLAVFLIGGCWDNPKPTAPVTSITREQRVEKILSATADDLELGAKVRTIVEKQQVPPPRHHYDLGHIMYGCVFVLFVAMLHHALITHDKQA